MPVDILQILLGFVTGVAATAIAVEASMRRFKNPERSSFTGTWDLHEMGPPGTVCISAERITRAAIPRGSKIMVKEKGAFVTPQLLQSAECRVNPKVAANFAVGNDRAFVFSSHIHEGARGIETVDQALVTSLQNEFARLWREAELCVEELSIAELSRWDNISVRTSGIARDVVRGADGLCLMHVADGGDVIEVVANDDCMLFKGAPVKVTGRLIKGKGHSTIRAERVERLMPSEQIHRALLQQVN